jgi:hypothetical protein
MPLKYLGASFLQRRRWRRRCVNVWLTDQLTEKKKTKPKFLINALAKLETPPVDDATAQADQGEREDFGVVV